MFCKWSNASRRAYQTPFRRGRFRKNDASLLTLSVKQVKLSMVFQGESELARPIVVAHTFFLVLPSVVQHPLVEGKRPKP